MKLLRSMFPFVVCPTSFLSLSKRTESHFHCQTFIFISLFEQNYRNLFYFVWNQTNVCYLRVAKFNEIKSHSRESFAIRKLFNIFRIFLECFNVENLAKVYLIQRKFNTFSNGWLREWEYILPRSFMWRRQTNTCTTQTYAHKRNTYIQTIEMCFWKKISPVGGDLLKTPKISETNFEHCLNRLINEAN